MKVAFDEIKAIIKECELSLSSDIIFNNLFLEIYHIHEWDHGYESRLGYSGTRRQFYYDMQQMLRFIHTYFKINNVTEFIVAPFHNVYQFNVYDAECDIYKEIYSFFKSYNIRLNARSGVRLSVDDLHVIDMIVEGNFRGISQLGILLPEIKVLVLPNHHFEFLFFKKDLQNQKQEIITLAKQFPDLVWHDEY